MIRRLLLGMLPAAWRDAIEGDLLETTRGRTALPQATINLTLLLIVIRFRWARIVEHMRRPGRSWPGAWVRDAMTDARYGLRRWRARPGSTAAAAGTVALGVGMTSALFSVVDGVLLKPLPYPQPERLVTINRVYPDWRSDPILASGWDRISLSYPEYFQVRDRTRTVEDLAVITTRVVVSMGPPAAELRAGVVSPGFFRLLGVEPALGRLFDEHDELDDPDAVILGYDTWRGRFGADPTIVGRRIRFATGDRVVRGVLPAGFHWGTRQLPYHVWLPLASIPLDERADNNRNLDAIARLRPGVTVAQATDEMSVLLRAVFRYSSTTGGVVTPLLERQLTRVRAPLLILLAGAGLLLAIACANVAGLASTDAALRGGEMAVRTSLGATRGRVIRQLLAEGALIAGAGALAGLLVAGWSIRALVALAPGDLPRAAEITLDARVVLVASAAAALTALACALLPAVGLQWGRRMAVRADRRGATARRRVVSVLTAVQVAVGMALLCTAGLFVRSLHELNTIDTGFDRTNVLSLRVGVPAAIAENTERTSRYLEDTRVTLATLPGVASVALTSNLPLISGRAGTTLTIPGLPPGRSPKVEAQRRFVSPEYFSTLRVRLLQGRFFDRTDTASTPPVTVVSAEMARRLWPDGAIGRRIVYAKTEFTVAGVAADTRDVALDSDPQPTFYLSTAQRPAWTRMFVLMRTAHDPLGLVASARTALAGFDPDLPVEEVRTLSDVVREATDDERYRTVLMTAFAAAATLLSGVGLYGTLARQVAERRREIGIRLALGARPGQVRRQFVAEGFRLAAAGAIVGVGVAMALAQAASTLLFKVEPTDTATLIPVTCAIALLAFAASYLPSRRTSRQDPAAVLRAEG